jgi:predicted lysophospholipase L1 biosynthesis ABC-type transport system permease subunit
MKIPFLGGRDFRPNDAYPAVAIVNPAFAKQYFNGENPIGRFFERVDPGGPRRRIEIVGLVGDARSRDNMRQPIRPTAYIPFQSIDSKGGLLSLARGTFVVRTGTANPLALASILRQEVARGRSEFRVSNLHTQWEFNQTNTVRERLLAVLAMFFAGVALLLAAVGLYGVMEYGVLQRRREIGIRIAIGAQAADIARRVTADVFGMLVVGAIAGLALGMASVRYIEALLFDVRPAAFSMVALPVVVIFGTACLAALPAVFRAVRLDPVSMLRAE